MPGQNSTRLGQRNRERVRLYFARNPGARQAACARSLGLSAVAVNRHIKALVQAANLRAQTSQRDMP